MDAPMTLTLDIGSSSVRALLWDVTGRQIEDVQAQIPYQMHTTPDGGVEFPPQAFLALVFACLDQAMTQVGARAQAIRAVGVTTFWHALIGLDAQGKPLTPLYSWADNRAAEAARRLRDKLDGAAIHTRTGCVLHPSYYPAKLVWLRETQPQIFPRVAQWVSPAEYLYGELFGPEARRISISMASGTGLFHQSRCLWDEETLSALDLTPDLLSPLTDLTDCPRGLRPEYAQRWPALRAVPFLPAVGDGACSNVGSGCLTPERFAINLGTSGAIRALWREAVPRVSGVGCRVSEAATNDQRPTTNEAGEREKAKGESLTPNTQYPTPNTRNQKPETKNQPPTPFGLWRYRVDANRPLIGTAFSDGGHVFAWMKRTLKLPEEAVLEQELAAMEPGAHGLTFLPYLAGERGLGWHLDARAALVGMNLDTSPVEIVRASMEAVTLQFVQAAQKLREVFPEQREIIASGGAFGHLPFWTQMFADALGQPVTRTAEPEASSRGAALLAMEAVGLLGALEDAPARFGETCLPEASRQAIYAEMLARQRNLYIQQIE